MKNSENKDALSGAERPSVAKKIVEKYLKKFTFPAQNGKDSMVVEAEDMVEAQKIYLNNTSK